MITRLTWWFCAGTKLPNWDVGFKVGSNCEVARLFRETNYYGDAARLVSWCAACTREQIQQTFAATRPRSCRSFALQRDCSGWSRFTRRHTSSCQANSSTSFPSSRDVITALEKYAAPFLLIPVPNYFKIIFYIFLKNHAKIAYKMYIICIF